MDEMFNDYCKCEDVKGVYSEIGEWGHWDKCCECNKVIEDSFTYHSDEQYDIND